MTTTYYTFDVGQGETSGLLRRSDDEHELAFATVQRGAWIATPGAIRFFSGQGGDQLDLVELTEPQARELAGALGV
jgi:hypothetical protein